MKICTRCEIPKDEPQFNRKGKRLQPFCRECNKLYLKQHYQANKAWYQKRNKNQKVTIREFISGFKKDKPCMDCGNVYPPYVMDFDHRENKKFDIRTHGKSNGNMV